MRRQFFIAVGPVFGLLLAGPLFAQRKPAEKEKSSDSCAEVIKACEDAGFRAGQGLRNDCFKPILDGKTQAPRSQKQLPKMDPQVVAACKSSQSSAAKADIAVSGAGASGTGWGVRPPSKAPLTPPAKGVYLGIWANPALSQSQEQAIEIREGTAPLGINRRFAFHLHYYDWGQIVQEVNRGNFPDDDLKGDIKYGRVPIISWKCDYNVASSDHVISGGNNQEDAIIRATAKALAQYPGPVLLRWFWEFNLLENPKHQTCLGDNKATPSVETDFIGAWQRIYNLFQQDGAHNVMFLWNPGFYWGTKHTAAHPKDFYPGNQYVDWIGIDSYQHNQTSTFDDNFGHFYDDFSTSTYGNKPLMVGENGSPNYAQHNTELQWAYLQGLLSAVRANRYSKLKAYCYFDSAGPDGKWVLDNNGKQNGVTALTIIGADPLFGGAPSPRKCSTPQECCMQGGGTWYGGKCH